MTGLDVLAARLGEIIGAAPAAAESGLAEGLRAAAAEAKALAPADTGRLKESIDSETERRGATASGRVYAGAEYAAYVELGGARPARPFLLPAVKATEGTIRDAVEKAVSRALKG